MLDLGLPILLLGWEGLIMRMIMMIISVYDCMNYIFYLVLLILHNNLIS